MQKNTAQTQKHSDGQQQIATYEEESIMQTEPRKFKPNAQCLKIIAHIRKHGFITSAIAAREFRIYSGFQARIHDIRRAGYPLVCTMHKGINQEGKPTKYGVYTLAAEKGA